MLARSYRLTSSALLAVLLAGCQKGGGESPAGVITVDTLSLTGLGDSVDFPMLAGPTLSEGGYAVASVQAANGLQLALFDQRGRLIKLFGRVGEGPGEVRRGASAAFAEGDSLRIFGSRHFHLFSPPPELRYVRTITRTDLVELKVLMATRDDPLESLPPPSKTTYVSPIYFQGRWWPPREITPTGEVRTYGTPIATDDPDGYRVAYARSSTEGLLWRYQKDRYAIELISPDSVHLRIQRKVDWFPDDMVRPSGPDRWRIRPGPSIQMVRDEGDGILWVVVKRPSMSWHPVNPRTAIRWDSRGLPVSIPTESLEERFESVIEALDAASGALLGSVVLLPAVYGFIAPRVTVQRPEDSTGARGIRLVRLGIQRHDKEK